MDMKFLIALAIFALALVSALVLLVMRFFFKSVKLFKTVNQRAEEDEDYFKRVSTKNYRKEEKPKFDKDYFKGTDDADAQKKKEKEGQQQKKPSDATQQKPKETRHTTDDGVVVTIREDHDPQKQQRKIFADDEGEYVDFTEV